MKILMISRDPKAVQKDSAVYGRLKKYAESLEELHVVVLSEGETLGSFRDGNLSIYPAFSKSKFSAFIKARNTAFKIAAKNTINLVTSQDPFEAGVLALMLKRKFKVKLHIQIHTDLFSPYFLRLSLKNKFHVLLAKSVLRHADSIRVVSQRIKDSLRGLNLQPSVDIEIKPIEVDIEKIKNAPVTIDLHQKYPQFKKIVLMIGRLEKEKNYELALEAFNEFSKKYSDIGLVIIGEGSGARKIERNVMWEGWTNDVYSYMKTADLFLHTSWYEGYGLVLKEAEVVGLPIISTDVGIAREVGATIVPFNAKKVAETIERKLQ